MTRRNMHEEEEYDQKECLLRGKIWQGGMYTKRRNMTRRSMHEEEEHDEMEDEKKEHEEENNEKKTPEET